MRFSVSDGSPSSESTFGPLTWYYVSSIHEHRSIMPEKVVDQHVIEIAFDSNGVVTSLKQYTLADGKNIEVASDTTPTEGQRLGFFEQIFDNLVLAFARRQPKRTHPGILSILGIGI